ncbi:hypothetical protein ACFWOT_19730 [Streptomyces sp. NPDC058440]|uniref:hypothetical protein n=1 Tax=Streptomyces sp. NPDC058440 TaxID=3346501 RepID=UPI0036518E1D
MSGQGLNAAAAMGQMRTVIRALSAFDLAPDSPACRTRQPNWPLNGPTCRWATRYAARRSPRTAPTPSTTPWPAPA